MLNIKLADKRHIKNLTEKDMDDSAIKFVQDNYGASYGEAKEIEDSSIYPLLLAHYLSRTA